ncbi:MAG TPA: type II toxin-antitoxin system VapC family toxin [Arenimonas sp.]|nr:type II toxin-antitoxin system VapC family toxin [Arenimonas sp.]
MIILDTNVLSEALRPTPDEQAVTWLGEQPRSTLFTTSLTQAELLYGIELLPPSARRSALSTAVQQIFREDFAGQVLSFDSDAADAYAEVAASRRRAGRPISQIDAMIAAIARSRGASLATRNVKDFVDCGVDLIDPWNHR